MVEWMKGHPREAELRALNEEVMRALARLDFERPEEVQAIRSELREIIRRRKEVFEEGSGMTVGKREERQMGGERKRADGAPFGEFDGKGENPSARSEAVRKILEQAERDGEPRTIVVDLDGMVIDYFGYKGPKVLGPAKPVAKAVLGALKARGWKIVVFTSRSWFEHEAIVSHLEAENVPFDQVVCGKPIGMLYLDDRGTGLGGDWSEIARWLFHERAC